MKLPIIAEDFSFYSIASRHVHDITKMANDDIAFMSLCFRKQKNNDNRPTLTYWYRTDSH
jgi:hypothetical protein